MLTSLSLMRMSRKVSTGGSVTALISFERGFGQVFEPIKLKRPQKLALVQHW